MARTFLQLQGAVQLRLADGDGAGAGDVRWTLAEKKDALNHAYRRFCRETEIQESFVTWTQDSGAVYKPGSSVKVVRLLADPQSATLGYTLTPTTEAALFACDPSWATTAGNPTYYVFPYSIVDDEKKFIVSPVPSVALTDLKCRCVIIPADMSANGDEPAIPHEFHDALVEGAVELLLQKKGNMADTEMATVAGMRFSAAINDARSTKAAGHTSRGGCVPFRYI